MSHDFDVVFLMMTSCDLTVTLTCAYFKGIIRVSKLQGIDLFYYLLDLRELANSNDMHKSLVGALF